MVSSRLTLGYTLATGAIFGSLMGYINSAQQIFVEVYGLGALFPVAFGLVACAIALASFLNSRFVMRLGMRKISHAALLGFVGVSLVHLLVEALFGQPPLPVFLLMLALALFCFGLLMPNFNAIAMEPMGRIAGTASSFIGCITTAVGAVIGFVIGHYFDGTVVPLVAGLRRLRRRRAAHRPRHRARAAFPSGRLRPRGPGGKRVRRLWRRAGMQGGIAARLAVNALAARAGIVLHGPRAG